MNKDIFFITGTLVAFIAAFLTIIERILSFRERYRSRKKEVSDGKHREKLFDTDTPTLSSPSSRTSWIHHSPLSFLFYREILIIGGAGILLNYLGLALSLRLESILFLDMTGTALVSFLLGPWWGAVVALLSSSAVNWLLYPVPDADYLIFPWSLVNMTGAFFWGTVARSPSFSRYLMTGHSSTISHLWFLTRLGVMGGVIMSITGTFVQAAIAEQTEIGLHSTVVKALEGLVAGWQGDLQGYFEPVLGIAWADSLGWAIVNWVQNCLRYIPDKTVTVSIALVVLKYGFPLFERELIHGGPTGHPPVESPFAPALLGLIYIPSFVTLLSGTGFMASQYWPLWSAPWVVILAGFCLLYGKRQPMAEIREARLVRAERYYNALKPIEREPSYQFCRRLGLATLVAGALVALSLPIFLADFVNVAFHFFCVVYGFLLSMHLVHVAISQNLFMARTGGFTTVEFPFTEGKPEKSRAKRAAQR